MKTYKDYIITEASLSKCNKKFMDNANFFYNNVRYPSASYVSRNGERIYNIGITAMGMLKLAVFAAKNNIKIYNIKTKQEISTTYSAGDLIGAGALKLNSDNKINSFSDIKSASYQSFSYNDELDYLLYYLKQDKVSVNEINDMINTLYEEGKKNFQAYQERKKSIGPALDKVFKDFH